MRSRGVLRSWMLLPLAGILVVAGLFWARGQAEEAKKDPLTKSQDWVRRSFGMTLEKQTTTGNGIKVESVEPGGVAAQAGVKAGDSVLAVGDRSVWHIYQFTELISQRMRAPIVPILTARGNHYELVRLPLNRVKTPPPLAEEESGHHH